jgi:hypothetical protein
MSCEYGIGCMDSICYQRASPRVTRPVTFRIGKTDQNSTENHKVADTNIRQILALHGRISCAPKCRVGSSPTEDGVPR